MKRLIALTILLAGCTGLSPYDLIDSRQADSTYRKLAFTATSSGGWGSATAGAIFIKTFDSNGKLGLCGFYTASGSGSGYVDLLGTSIASHDSALFVDDEKVGNLAFLRLNASERDAMAGCVRAKVDWKPGYAKAKLNIYLPSVRGQA